METKAADYIDLKLELWLRKRNKGSIKWTTKDGNSIAIKDLSDSHLENILRHLEKKDWLRENYLDALSGYDKDF